MWTLHSAAGRSPRGYLAGQATECSASTGAAVERVFSHGQLRLRSLNPVDDPIVELGTLSDERDLIRLRDAIRRLIAVVSQPDVAEDRHRLELRWSARPT